MENISSIAIPAIVTLIVTMFAGLAIEYFKHIKPKLRYSVKESVPIELDDKKIGANIIYITNPSSKSVKDIVLKIRSKNIEIKNGGVKTTIGLDYEVVENQDSLEIKIPFLKFKDYLSITTILESKYYIPSKPEVTVRSPDNFKLIEDDEPSDRRVNLITVTYIVPAIVASIGVGIALAIHVGSLNVDKFDLGIARNGQGTNLTLAAALIGLPELAKHYVSNETINYYNQGPFVYSLAKATTDLDKVRQYGEFLEATLEISTRILPRSKATLQFFIGKIKLLENKKGESEVWLKKARDTQEEEYDILVEFFRNEGINKSLSSTDNTGNK
ncbi:MAG: hypothetical protein U1D41_11215 [Nitrosomonas sp.]|uniref:hypothetical protein n=1 Tax=Nitrosomonas sp. TaxID=42353 RepID=UPI00271DDDDB|nr:hypothetical protein [Nitrosomonas sp.]MDO8991958.1 hypothetical protein [Daejeonella sp.]MDP3281795.1 hypothetical protein [Nitrosomonas sp.]MDP3661851.1 hypothetical protein [Nitrosomonas sp.]MDZ4106709.1 hypothetical protein [Nitrosomonas sp.]